MALRKQKTWTAAKSFRNTLYLFLIGSSYSVFFWSAISVGVFEQAGLKANFWGLAGVAGVIFTMVIFAIAKHVEATRKTCPWWFVIVFGLTPPLLFVGPICAFGVWKGLRTTALLRAQAASSKNPSLSG